MNNLLFVFLYGQNPEGGGGYSSFIFLLLIIVVFYMFFIRPQVKRTKDQKKFREALKKGDKVITIGGIHGKILEVREKDVILEVEGQSKLRVEKSAIALDSNSQIEQTAK